jgi:PAS domain S-box-containing protein
MLAKKESIKIILIWSLGFFLSGIIAMLLILFFALAATGKTVSPGGFNSLYHEHNIFYLINVFPLLMTLAGFAAGKKQADLKNKHDRKIQEYELILKGTADFAKQIGKRNFNIRYQPVNGEKVFAESLESMRESIVTAYQKEMESNETIRISGELSRILQKCNDIESLCNTTINYLVMNLDNIAHGAFYIVEKEGDDQVIRMMSGYARERRKYLSPEFKVAKGLVGQAAEEKELILRTEIPDEYLITTIDAGDVKPQTLIIAPLVSNDVVHGVIELASFQKITRYQCELLKELSSLIARALENVRNNLRTYKLLKESELLGAELSDQKKQLTKNAQDLLKTQEELKYSNLRLEEQIQEVYNTGKRTQVLLENAKEIVLIISDDNKVLYVSPSVRSIAGYFPEELLGRSETENIHPLDTERFKRFLNDLRSFPENEMKIQLRYFTRGGEVIWMEATGKNLLGDAVIKGFVVNLRDISEQRAAAREQRIRAKMEALSENSSDLILRIDIFSRCTYINPVIGEYTGLSKDEYLGKPLNNTGMPASVITSLKQMLDEVSKTKKRMSSEMVFTKPQGDRIMKVNAIPEFAENGETESVLFACNDITEAKAREGLIRKKNKSISDSINYALNIQSALMPGEEDLRKIFPNSFMFYKPKDTVSGDYPWLFRKGNIVYIGTMDCTGHGVPGALMSIIGYFLQDAIMHQDADQSAGDVLNRLHKSVVERLKQSEPGSMINDGMDAAFCKIDLKRRTLDFAGAHRSLYLVSNGILTEIKGDKFPVGSTQYRNRKDFNNHSLSMKSGDAVYFMTDGFPDQFGGPTGKQKFTSEGVVRLIRDNVHLSIFQMRNLFSGTFESWKGSVNQTDDILVIGLKIP